jgi:hypothetical protein
MIRPICSLVIAVLPLACGSNNSGAGDDGDLTLSQVFVDLAPIICHRMQQCDPTDFAQSFPSGESGCVSYFEGDDPDPSKTVSCTQSQANACGNDIANEPCSQVLPMVGVSPTLPASCDGC